MNKDRRVTGNEFTMNETTILKSFMFFFIFLYFILFHNIVCLSDEENRIVENLEGKSSISVDGETGFMTSVDFLRTDYDKGVLLVEKRCHLYFDREDGEECLNDMTFFIRDKKSFKKKWEVRNVEGDNVSTSGEFIYVVTYGCCGGPDVIKIYELNGTFLVESFSESESNKKLYVQWRKETTVGNNEYREGLLGFNEQSIFYLNTFNYKPGAEGNNLLYKGVLPTIPDCKYFYQPELVSKNTVRLSSTSFMQCECEVYFEINDSTKSLDFIKHVPINCDE